MYVYIYIYIYVCMHLPFSLSLYLSLSIYIYICIYVCCSASSRQMLHSNTVSRPAVVLAIAPGEFIVYNIILLNDV